MRQRVVTVIGAGNMRCAPAVAAGLAVWCPDELVEIRLYDTNEERLDLVDRLARECLDREDAELTVKSVSDLDEALQGASDVVFTVHEDCARRYFGQQNPEFYQPSEPGSLAEQVRGDPNKPTSPDLLSERMKQILSSPADGRSSREEVILAMLVEAMALVPAMARILSLMRGVLLPTVREHVHLNWPSPLDADKVSLVPHQILRWIHGESSLSDLIVQSQRSPFVEWLRRADR